MIEPYNAVGLIPSFWGIRRREEIKHNIEHLKSLTKAAFWLSNLDIPNLVRETGDALENTASADDVITFSIRKK